MSERAPGTPDVADCGFCGYTYSGRPNQCKRCGHLLNHVVGDVRRLGQERRRRIRSQKAISDTIFLIGLLLGGPIMTFGSNFGAGLFVVLAGGISSVLRRYTDWSTPGTVVVGSVVALIVATGVADAPPDPEAVLAAEVARGAYVMALSQGDPDVIVESRGLGHIAVWFTVPGEVEGECGEYPPARVREHLAALGFRRIVVAMQNRSGGLCSFRP